MSWYSSYLLKKCFHALCCLDHYRRKYTEAFTQPFWLFPNLLYEREVENELSRVQFVWCVWALDYGIWQGTFFWIRIFVVYFFYISSSKFYFLGTSFRNGWFSLYQGSSCWLYRSSHVFVFYTSLLSPIWFWAFRVLIDKLRTHLRTHLIFKLLF